MKRVISILVILLLVSTVIAASSSGVGHLRLMTSFSLHSDTNTEMISPARNQMGNSRIVPRTTPEKVILLIQTRNNWITVYSGERSLFYSVGTDTGIPLAEYLTPSELKVRFPELYDVVTGWAGDVELGSGLKR